MARTRVVQGGTMGWGIKISAPKISVPSIKIAAPKISAPKIAPIRIAAPKISAPKIAPIKISPIKIPPPKLPTIQQVANTAVKVALAPVSVTTHVVKQVGGSKLTSQLDDATKGTFSTLNKGELPNIKQVIAVANAVNPVNVTDKVVKQTFGHKGVEFLDRTTGGTYSQAIRVGNLPGRAVAGEAIKSSDWVDAASFALKVVAVASAGSAAGFAIMMAKQYAAKELAKKVGGSAGALVEMGANIATGGDVISAAQEAAISEGKRQATAEAAKRVGGSAGALVQAGADIYGGKSVAEAAQTAALSEGKRVATQEVVKKVGGSAGSLIAVGTAAYTGGSDAAIEATKSEAKTAAEKELEKKTGIPIGIMYAVKDGKVPSYQEMKEKMTGELMRAPEKLMEEIKAMPDKIAAAPAQLKDVYKAKVQMMTEELSSRDKIAGKLLTEGSEKLKENHEKLIASVKDTDLSKAKFDVSKKDMEDAYNKAQKAKEENHPDAPKLAEEFKKKEDVHTANSIALGEADKKSVELVLKQETIKEETASKIASASEGKFGVRFDEKGQSTGVQPVPAKMQAAVASVTSGKVKGIDFPLLADRT